MARPPPDTAGRSAPAPGESVRVRVSYTRRADLGQSALARWQRRRPLAQRPRLDALAAELRIHIVKLRHALRAEPPHDLGEPAPRNGRPRPEDGRSREF